MCKPQTIRRGHAAMGTWFEVVLRGVAIEHLDDVASMAFEEFDRIERLLSRFDPRSEVSRINREAATRTLRIDEELFEVLSVCQSAWASTDGYFDVTAAPTASTPPTSFAFVELDDDRTIRFTRPDLALDLGGIGKGYALDRAADVLSAFGIDNALLHGGTSSVLAMGDDGTGEGWGVGARDPFLPPDVAPELFSVRLNEQGFSCSAVFGQNQQAVSDLIDPHQGRPLSEPAACVVIADSGALAEVYSTALLAMGRTKARGQSERLDEAVVSALWIALEADRPVWEWITGAAT